MNRWSNSSRNNLAGGGLGAWRAIYGCTFVERRCRDAGSGGRGFDLRFHRLHLAVAARASDAGDKLRVRPSADCGELLAALLAGEQFTAQDLAAMAVILNGEVIITLAKARAARVAAA